MRRSDGIYSLIWNTLVPTFEIISWINDRNGAWRHLIHGYTRELTSEKLKCSALGRKVDLCAGNKKNMILLLGLECESDI